MKCYYHNREDAVGNCSECGKALCRECTGRYSPVLCESCANERIEATKGAMMKNIILSIVLFIVGLIMDSMTSGGIRVESFATAYCFAGFPWGWSALNKFTANVFLFLPIVGWLIYFCVKGFLAIIIGWIALPIKMVKSITEIKRMNNLQN